MRQIILIDPIEKLTIEKDSTIYFSNTLKKSGVELIYLFKEDFNISTSDKWTLKGHRPEFEELNGTVVRVNLVAEDFNFISGDILHMRLEPPFDISYLRILWMLDFLKRDNVGVINNPKGIMNFQEKVYPLSHQDSIPSAVIQKYNQLESFISKNELVTEFIFKPLDLFQGLGVTKVLKSDINKELFENIKNSFNGMVLVQPFISKIISGEIRSIYYAGQEIGSIVKVPPKGSFLANIAQGATFEKISLSKSEKRICDDFSKELLANGVPWVAFDILDGKISEANTTCPGLLVEVSKAYGENLAERIIQMM